MNIISFIKVGTLVCFILVDFIHNCVIMVIQSVGQSCLYINTIIFAVDEVKTRMDSLRTIFSKIKTIPSGSAANALRPRQKRVRQLCGFLRFHLQYRGTQSNLDKVSRQELGQPGSDQPDTSDGEDVPPRLGRVPSIDGPAGFATPRAPSVQQGSQRLRFDVTDGRQPQAKRARGLSVSSEPDTGREVLTQIASTVQQMTSMCDPARARQQSDIPRLWTQLLCVHVQGFSNSERARRFMSEVDQLYSSFKDEDINDE
jgi:hypothetical protein